MQQEGLVVVGELGGSFELREKIGEGGTAVIHRALSRDGSEVAIKSLLTTSDTRQQARFRRELQVAAALSHPSLIQVIDHGNSPELGAFMVMPLIRGTTLRDFTAGRSLTPESALCLIFPLLDALTVMHAARLAHRDLKPENVMLDEQGALTLVDLGLTLGPDSTRLTEEGTIAGSIPYMSPEQIEGAEINTATDVWSIAVMFYELLAGSRPFQRERPTEELAAILVGDHEAIADVDRRCDPDLARVLESCLSQAARDRPQTAHELRAALIPFIDWTTLDGLHVERKTLARSIEEFESTVSEMRVHRIQHEAAAAIDAGDGFQALKLLDRGLAYRPDAPELQALVEGATKASAGTQQTAWTAERAFDTTDRSSVRSNPSVNSIPKKPEDAPAPASALPRVVVIIAIILILIAALAIFSLFAGLASCAMACHDCTSVPSQPQSTPTSNLVPGPPPPSTDALLASPRARDIAVGDSHACAVVEGGSVHCWGRNDQGQLGDGSGVDSATPTTVGNLRDVVQVTVGSHSTCARENDGSVHCWGRGSEGQLGNGLRGSSPTPTDVQVLPPVRQLDAGEDHICAVIEDGTVMCWGHNLYGQCGANSEQRSIHQLSPTRVAELSDVVHVEAAARHSCALRHDGTVWCWGSNANGRLGFGGRFAQSSPVRVTRLQAIRAISLGSDHSCALDAERQVHCWGDGAEHQLGTTRESNVPLLMAVEGVRSLSAGARATCVVMMNGTVRCWGTNEYGQLGPNRDQPIRQPTLLPGIDGATRLALGHTFLCALSNRGYPLCQGLLGPRFDGQPPTIFWPTATGVAFRSQ